MMLKVLADTCMAAIKYDVSNNEIMAILAVDATPLYPWNHSANN